MSDAHDGTQTLRRALAVLKAFGGSTAPLANAELVRRTGFSKASISRINASLLTLGYLERAPDGVRCQIAIRAPMLGTLYRANHPFATRARPLMQALADRYGVSVALATADAHEMLYVEYCRSECIVGLVRLGHPAMTLALSCGGILPASSGADLHASLAPDLLRTAALIGAAMRNVDSELI